MATSLTTLRASCAICPATISLQTCSACKCIQYCSREHQAKHRPMHKRECKDLVILRNALHAVQEIDKDPRDMDSSITLVTFLHELFQAELRLDYKKAVEAGVAHVLEATRIAAANTTWVVDLVVPSFIRLGKDQEAFDFLHWWVLDASCFPDRPRQHYTTVSGKDILEPMCHSLESLTYLATASLALLKLRALMDLEALQRSSAFLNGKLPQEIIDKIGLHIVHSTVTRQTVEKKDHSKTIERLVCDVTDLYSDIFAGNETFWLALMGTSESHFVEESGETRCPLAAGLLYRAWAETHGAREALGALIESMEEDDYASSDSIE